jgi:hypothetical protein
LKAAVAKLEAGELVSDDSLNALVATQVLSAKTAQRELVVLRFGGG